MSLKNFIKVYPGIKDPKIISKCIRFLNKSFNDKKFIYGGLFNNGDTYEDKKVRDVNIMSLTNKSASLSLVHWANFLSFIVLNGMRSYANDFPSVKGATVFDIQALRYGIGGHYDFHCDDGPGMNRKYSSILLLNNDYEGGELCFRIDDKIEVIENKPGSLIIWPSNFMFPHAVKPLTKGTRYSIVSWMH